MITLLLLIKSIFIGFVVAMPVGPIGVLCIDHSIRGGIKQGVSAGVGAALADGIFGFIGGIGSAALISGVAEPWLFQLIGAFLILVIGIKNLFTSKDIEHGVKVKSRHLKTCITTFILTLTNPLTVLSFAAIFAGLGIVLEDTPGITALYLGVGIFLGSLLWWLSLSFFSSLISKKMNLKNVKLVSRVSGGLLILMSALLFLNVLTNVF